MQGYFHFTMKPKKQEQNNFTSLFTPKLKIVMSLYDNDFKVFHIRN